MVSLRLAAHRPAPISACQSKCAARSAPYRATCADSPKSVRSKPNVSRLARATSPVMRSITQPQPGISSSHAISARRICGADVPPTKPASRIGLDLTASTSWAHSCGPSAMGRLKKWVISGQGLPRRRRCHRAVAAWHIIGLRFIEEVREICQREGAFDAAMQSGHRLAGHFQCGIGAIRAAQPSANAGGVTRAAKAVRPVESRDTAAASGFSGQRSAKSGRGGQTDHATPITPKRIRRRLAPWRSLF